jgi:DNA-binding IclR family transcriptional regulator
MTLQSVDRAVDILRLFTPDVGLLGVSDIGRALELDRSVVQRTIASLVNGGLLEQDAVSSKYRLGLGLIEFAGTMLQSRNIPAIVRPFLRELTDLVGESVYLAVLYRGDSVLQLDDVASAHLIQYPGWTGRRLPLYCTSSGKVLLANMTADRLDELLGSTTLRSLTAKTITDREALRQELSLVRERGYATDFGEFQDGVNAVAAAVPGPSGGAQACIAIVGPAYRFSETAVMESTGALVAVANGMANRLAYPVLSP